MNSPREVADSLIEVLRDKAAVIQALTTLKGAAEWYGEYAESRFLAMARGYINWLKAGLAPLNIEGICTVSNSAPNPETAFDFYINGVFSPLEARYFIEGSQARLT